MRIFYGLLYAFAVGFFSTQALADTQSYCEVFGQDFANGKTSDVDTWEVNFRNAFGDCMAQYAGDAKVEACGQESRSKRRQKSRDRAGKGFFQKEEKAHIATGINRLEQLLRIKVCFLQLQQRATTDPMRARKSPASRPIKKYHFIP